MSSTSPRSYVKRTGWSATMHSRAWYPCQPAPRMSTRCSGKAGVAAVSTTVAMVVSPFASRYRQEPQRRGALLDLLGIHDGLGLELDVDRAARGQVDGRDVQPAVLVDGELDADGAASRKLLGKVERGQADFLAVGRRGAVALAGHHADVHGGLVVGVGTEVADPLHGNHGIAGLQVNHDVLALLVAGDDAQALGEDVDDAEDERR